MAVKPKKKKRAIKRTLVIDIEACFFDLDEPQGKLSEELWSKESM